MSRVVVYGGNGALGRQCLAAFRRNKWETIQVDFAPAESDVNIIVKPEQSPVEQQKLVQEALRRQGLVDAVLCCSGGWAGGNAADEDLLPNTQSMISSSLYSSLICASLATPTYLKPKGVIMLPGAAAVDKAAGTAGMIPYGVAKAAVHQLLNSLNSSGSGLAPGATAFGIAPITLDTPMNRTNMPKADFSTWTPLEDLAEQIFQWTRAPPAAGMYLCETRNGKTEYKLL